MILPAQFFPRLPLHDSQNIVDRILFNADHQRLTNRFFNNCEDILMSVFSTTFDKKVVPGKSGLYLMSILATLNKH